ncbi:UDP-N-acetylmuramoyl-tripeptide--D-alanyl-D-alanine ligase [Halomonas sp. Bachu 37]|uniref:UDP-N-acetylmuramoyl-tripeptide--D-alanyl-D- alanine ligase n=1 Tax=Halomonas kashgarensis TaxID=3084920 RepID=UPI003216A4DA
MNWTLARASQALGETLTSHDVALNSIVTDTRRLSPGALFVALEGERFDGHEFLAQAREAGAAAAVVSRKVDDPLPQLLCSDTRLALGLLAREQRRAWGKKLVAITGNSGKTTVKEILAHLLGGRQQVLATEGNLNNDIGAPLTLLRLSDEHRAAVVELGANHLGEIAWTTALALPQVAVITNVTGAHVGEFGGMGRIAQAKAEILGGLAADGLAVLNSDDAYFTTWKSLAAPRKVCSFGLNNDAMVTANALSCDASGRYAFTLVAEGVELGRVTLPLLGRHNVSNALAAAAAALALGLDGKRLVERLGSVTTLPGRLCVVSGVRGTRLLDDTYNANPGAMHAALETLAELPGPHWCALGAMGELGEASASLHAEVGRRARELDIERLFTIGEAARPAAQAFGPAAQHFDDHAALVRHLINSLPSGASVLVKGSRSAGMEAVVSALRTDEPR